MEKYHEHFFSASLNHFFFSTVMMMMMVVHGLSHGHPSDQAGRLSALWDYTENPIQGVEVDDHNLNMVSNSLRGGDEVAYHDQVGKMEDDLIEGGLPGQPSKSNFKQYAGYVSVDEPKGRSLFYYFVEASLNPSSKPLVLWLNGGPGCSSVGIGAMVEIGPFGVKPDGKTLYTRKHAWNKVANVLFVESPAGVGFSYSNTTSDYNLSGDKRTAQDAYTFLLNWFRRFPQYKDRDFYITGESYAGFYIPELTDTIIKGNKEANPSSMIQLKGIMIGNGVMNLDTDRRGRYDYTWSHALISDETHRGLIENCLTSSGPKCDEIRGRIIDEMGDIDLYNIYAPQCLNSSQLWKQSKCRGGYDPCEGDYVRTYLNLPQVQEALHANRTKLPYTWEACSGDVDAVVPVSSTRYSIEALNLKVVKAWHPWLDAIGEVAGYEVVYNGLTFATVRGAGHQVPQFKPQRALGLLKKFLAGH
ncbi:hypothetical protein RHSIM_Rhsim11G0168200 [Rhododendron simsii]|uniref:Carboxypeptidase n=1 Tax=Rhododendron simsii TaxID=118357 RepID=A0A834G7G5_RHOSS|nr:hypothetical protein RHSIM_Rhsim11G0168200 [Rhododendron simsii]